MKRSGFLSTYEQGQPNEHNQPQGWDKENALLQAGLRGKTVRGAKEYGQTAKRGQEYERIYQRQAPISVTDQVSPVCKNEKMLCPA